MSSREEVVEDFETFGVSLEDDKLVEKCVSLCQQYGINSEELAACWMSFSTSHSVEIPSEDALDQLERDILAKKNKKSHTSNSGFKLCDLASYSVKCEDGGQDEEDLLAAYGGTPTQQTKRSHGPDVGSSKKRHGGPARSISAQFSPSTLSPNVATPSQIYSKRTNSGTVVVTYGDGNKATWIANSKFTPKMRSLGMGGVGPLTKIYKHMFEPARITGEILNDVILTLEDQMKDLLGPDVIPYTTRASHETVFVAGRICCDGVGHLNAASVLLEASRETCKAVTVHLDLAYLKQFSLFPGQIVGIKGVNVTGNKVRVQEIIPGHILPLPSDPISISSDSGPVQVVVGCGPFTTSDNLLYEPLTDLLATIQNNPPHFLILLGPILDTSHPLLRSSELGETQEAMFNRCLKMITSALESLPTQVILVSSSRDYCAPTYPTPPYSLGGSVTCVSDPALLNIEGVVMALTSTDILFHLGKEEISFPPQGSDRLRRLVHHILLQQSMYPLYPPGEHMCITYEQAWKHARLPCTPHVLILPSDLRYFVKEVENCVVVNPERLAKGSGGGTYARLELHSPSPKQTMVSSVIANIVRV